MKITVCDHCGTKDGVQAGGGFDLCGPCAWRVLDRLAKSTVPGMREAVLADVAANARAGQTEKSAPVDPLSVEDQIKQRLASLFVEHNQKIFVIKPEKAPLFVPATLKYGPDHQNVLAIERVPGKPGEFFAKIVV